MEHIVKMYIRPIQRPKREIIDFVPDDLFNATNSRVTEIISKVSHLPERSKYLDGLAYAKKYRKTMCCIPNIPERVNENTLPTLSEPPPPPPVIDYTQLKPLHEKYYTKCKKPPLIELLRCMSKAGYRSEAMNKAMKTYKWFEDNQEEIYEELERIWPSTKTVKNTSVRKVLKAVRKI
jgi:hypothetical protein